MSKLGPESDFLNLGPTTCTHLVPRFWGPDCRLVLLGLAWFGSSSIGPKSAKMEFSLSRVVWLNWTPLSLNRWTIAPNFLLRKWFESPLNLNNLFSNWRPLVYPSWPSITRYELLFLIEIDPNALSSIELIQVRAWLIAWSVRSRPSAHASTLYWLDPPIGFETNGVLAFMGGHISIMIDLLDLKSEPIPNQLLLAPLS